MSSIEKIVADYETCKKAWNIGLRIESVFSYYENSTVVSTLVRLAQSNNLFIDGCELFSAPTAEEVPLPKTINLAENARSFLWFNKSGRAYYLLEGFVTHQADNVTPKDNEATVRLMMAIWLIENVPEAKQWYKKMGVLHV